MSNIINKLSFLTLFLFAFSVSAVEWRFDVVGHVDIDVIIIKDHEFATVYVDNESETIPRLLMDTFASLKAQYSLSDAIRGEVSHSLFSHSVGMDHLHGHLRFPKKIDVDTLRVLLAKYQMDEKEIACACASYEMHLNFAQLPHILKIMMNKPICSTGGIQ